MAEVTSLEEAIRVGLDLDPLRRAAAIVTPERPVQIDGASTSRFIGERIVSLAERMPAGQAGKG